MNSSSGAAVTEHSEEDAGQFMRGGGDGRGRTEFGTKTAKKGFNSKVLS